MINIQPNMMNRKEYIKGANHLLGDYTEYDSYKDTLSDSYNEEMPSVNVREPLTSNDLNILDSAMTKTITQALKETVTSIVPKTKQQFNKVVEVSKPTEEQGYLKYAQSYESVKDIWEVL